MKKLMKSILVATMLSSVVLGNGSITNAAAVKPTATTKPVATPAPIMDNLSKYGLKKNLELPVTLTAGGLSYTLEKFMIYDFNSKDAQNLIKQYNYDSFGRLVSKPTHFIWTKITIKNNSKKIVKRSLDDRSDMWSLSLQDGGKLDQIWPKANANKLNNKEAFYYYTLKPGEQLTTYQAYLYDENFKYFVIRLFNGNEFDEKFVVNSQG